VEFCLIFRLGSRYNDGRRRPEVEVGDAVSILREMRDMNEKERRAARRARDRERSRPERDAEPRVHRDHDPVRERRQWERLLDGSDEAGDEDAPPD
jgi:hypothetical protein